jgi:CheY-like chemotaxis protein
MPRGPLVIIVEDHPLHARMMRRALTLRVDGARVEVFADGLAALRRLTDRSAEAPDLLVLDLALPGRSGHELLADRAADGRLARIPAAVVTSSTLSSDHDRSLALGATAHLLKPVDTDGFMELAERLGELLRLPAD